MAHFAKLGIGNIVEKVEVVANEVITDNNQQEQESLGQEFLRNLYNEQSAVWKQTSYNANFRKHFASPTFTYNENLDAFIPPKPFNSWTLNETTCLWEAPVAKPTDGQNYTWNETNQTWDLVE
jgi:hypothetical protein